MKLSLLKLSVTSVFIMSIVSCKKDKKDIETPSPTAESGVYATYSTGNQDGERAAWLWKAGEQIALADAGTHVFTNGIAVAANGDVYVSGCECVTSYIIPSNIIDDCSIVVWRNDVKQQLTQIPFFEESKGFVRLSSNGDVFVGGTERVPGNAHSSISLWKNGVKQNITDGSSEAEIYSLAVSGSDIYIAGEETPTGQQTLAVLWKNGVRQVLSDGTLQARAEHVFVSGNDVYVVVQQNNDQPRLLKNSVLQTLPDNVWINAIYVDGNDVYLAGFNAFTNMKGVWKNGQLAHELIYSEQNTGYRAESLYVHNGDVYAGGSVTVSGGEIGVIWKNGVLERTLTPPSPITYVPDIIVR